MFSLVNAVILADMLHQVIIFNFGCSLLSIKVNGDSCSLAGSIIIDGHMVPFIHLQFFGADDTDGVVRERMAQPKIQLVVFQQQVVPLITVAMVLCMVKNSGQWILLRNLDP